MVQGYSFNEFGDALEWPELREMLLMTLCPADFERVARKKLQAVKQTGPDVSQYCSFQQGIEPVLQRLATGSAVPV